MQESAALSELGVHAAQAMPGANGVPCQSVRAGTKSSQQARDDSDLSKQPRGPQAARPNTSFKLRVETPPDGLRAAMWDLSMRPSTATLLVAARQALGAQPTIGEQRRQRAHAQLSARSGKVCVPLIPLHLRCLLRPPPSPGGGQPAGRCPQAAPRPAPRRSLTRTIAPVRCPDRRPPRRAGTRILEGMQRGRRC